MSKKGNVNDYINAFNVAVNRCPLLPESEQLFLFEEGLLPAIALQVYNAQCHTLKEAQQVAQAAGLALHVTGGQNFFQQPKKTTAYTGGKFSFSGPGNMDWQAGQGNSVQGLKQGKGKGKQRMPKDPDGFKNVKCF